MVLNRSSHPTRWMALILLSTVAILSLGSGTAPAADDGPTAALVPLAANGKMTLSPSDRCPVCAMFPYRKPDYVAAMTLRSGRTFYFCSNGCLLRAWLRPTTYIGATKETIDRMVVLDYFSGQPIDGRSATWVAGSDAVGPMGAAVVALGEAGQSAAFKKRHGGDTVFTFDQLDDDLWRRIGRHDLPAEKAD